MRVPALLPSAGFHLPGRGSGWNSSAQLAAACAVSAVAGVAVALSGDWRILLGLLAAAAFTATGMVRPALFLAVFLVVRPLLDDLSNLTAGVPSANVGGALGVLLIGIFVVTLAARGKLYAPPTTGALLAVMLASVVAALQAVFALGAGTVGLQPIIELVRLGALVAIYVLAANLFGTPDRARRMFEIVALSALVPAIYGVVQVIVGPPVAEGVELARASGPFVGPNPFGAYLAVGVLLLLFAARSLPGWVRWPAVVTMLVALAGTYSRMGWIFLLLGVVILGWRQHRRVVVAMIVAVVCVGAAVPDVRERALPVEATSTSSASEGGYESFNWRIDNWDGLIDRWQDQPLLGYGLGSTPFVNPRRLTGQESSSNGGYDAHNMVVRILVEGGIVLFLVYAIFLVSLLRSVNRLRRERWELAHLGRVVFVMWVLILVVGLGTDDPLEISAVMYAMLAVTGALEGARRMLHAPATAR